MSAKTWRDELPSERLESHFQDFKPGLSDSEAVVEASRCINCFDAPCIQACPTRINIPQFISRIASGNVKGSARTILDSNILGLSCARSCPTEVLCEGACVYNDLDHKPIAIGKLQRYSVEHAYSKGWEFYQPGRATGRKVALVGAGPASLACAHELRKQGHEAVIFEKSKLAGGLNTTGIAPYKMKAEVGLGEIDHVLKMGVEIRYGQDLGRNVKLEELISEFDAVFLGLGLGPDSRFDAAGGDLPGVHGAVEFIAKLKGAPAAELAQVRKARAALVVGGGNTALDVCRELKALGLPRVVVSYRRDEAAMSGYAHETKWAKQEGVEFWFNTLPTELVKSGEGGLVAKIARTRLGSGGKVEVTDESLDLNVDLVLIATGQAKLESLLKGVSGLRFEKGRLLVDEQGRSGHAKIFAGGDLANGGMEVVNAVAEGKRAAQAIHQMLGGGK